MSDLKLTDREWKEFKVSEIFKINNSKPYHKKNLEIVKKGVSYITRTSENNGLEDIIKEGNFTLNKGNTISFGAENADFFYQSNDYVSGNKMYSISHAKISRSIGLFLVQVFRTSIKNCGFGYGKGLTGTRMMNRIVLLPIDNQKNPDWQFMEDYIKQIETKQRKQILIYYKSLINNDYPIQKIKLTDREWEVFKIGDIFKVSGTKTTHPSMLLSNGKTPRITCASTNNALDGFYKNAPTEKGGVIAVDSATDAYLSYQKNDFIATDHVEKISMKGDLYMSKEIGLFLKKAIDNSKLNKFGYGYKFSQTRMKKQLITLPVDKNNKPDWQFMEDYIKYKQLKIVKKIMEYYGE